MGCITAYNHFPSPKSRCAFEELLKETQSNLNEASQSSPSDYLKLNGTALESAVCDEMKKCSGRYGFEKDDIVLLSGHNFPDIITKYLSSPKYFGVEVKTTKEDKWTSTGSSIVESTRNVNVDNIYMFFGKLAKPHAEFKVRKYEECLSDITVTHSPRYLIDMELADETDIFSKMTKKLGDTIEYDSFRLNPRKIDIARQYYRRLAEENGRVDVPWWLESDDDFTYFPDLKEEDKRELIAKGFILFIDDILKSDYKRYVKWLCKTFLVVDSNVRDKFSAGGKVKMKIGGNVYGPYPQVVRKIFDYRKVVKNILDGCSRNYNFRADIVTFWMLKDKEFKEDFYAVWEGKLKEALIRHLNISRSDAVNLCRLLGENDIKWISKNKEQCE